MIDNEYLRVMSRYNNWQNEEVFLAADALSDDQRNNDNKAFWGSIIGTLSHIYWADQIWLSRFDIIDAPSVGIKESASYISDWDALKSKRKTLDTIMIDFCDSYEKGAIVGNLKFFSGALQKNVETPLPIVFAHFFNHQTHHRGQTNALLSKYGAKTGDTDLFLMPKNLWPTS